VERITDAIRAGELTVPIATFPIEHIREAVTVLAARHVRGKIAITMSPPGPAGRGSGRQ
jgi:hypothetical protein